MNKNSLFIAIVFIVSNIILNGLIYMHVNSSNNEIKSKSLKTIRILSAIVMVQLLYKLGTFMSM